MLKKVIYYMLGVSLGVVMVYFFFGDRDIQCSYFPNDRVLYDLRKKDFSFAEDLQPEDTLGLEFALERAKIDFSRSEIGDRDCNIYYLDFEEKKKTFVIENCDSTAFLIKVESE
ncbi:MAG: hypothetical protein NXI09_08885 [Bacteroidetes bacterium]|nr:hypothetical protein [Bacteroidota bacterium]